MSKATQPAEERRAKQLNSTGLTGINARVMARIVVDDASGAHREYVVDGYSAGPAEAVERMAGGIDQ